jgi:ABC-2 type transport system ATP-binding protein
MDAAISIEGLTRHFGEIHAVRDLSFLVSPGELFGIVGPDGAGKTTTLRMLSGVLRPTEGDAKLAGVSVVHDPEGVKHHIAYMSQRFGLYGDLTVRENIEFYADLYRVSRRLRPARLERLYAFSNLGPFENRLAGQLSGGMKQKLALCCALIHEPEILLLDEPTFGVDPISRRDLWLIVHEMVSEGVTVVVSTAYMDEAERCDRVMLLYEGRSVAIDAPGNLQKRLAGRIFVLRAEKLRLARELLQGHPAVRSAVLFGDTIHVTLESEDRWVSVCDELKATGIALLEEKAAEPSLEDVFIEMVQREIDDDV